MAENRQLFRKVALDRLSSPEQLDQILQITTPKGWMALVALGGLIILALIWGVYGSVTTKVTGSGIFIRGEGVKDISAPDPGKVTAVYVSPGDMVQRGQLVARVAQPELISQIAQLRSKISELRAEKKELEKFSSRELDLQARLNQKQRQSINDEIQALKEKIQWLKERRENQKNLLNKGLITRQKYLNTIEEIDAAKQKISRMKNNKDQLPLKLLKLKEEQDQKLRSKTMQINEVKREISTLQERLEQSSKVESSYRGRILELAVSEGSRINADTRIASLELVGKAVEALQAALYIPADLGKKVRPGMQARISPSTVDAEEYGMMLGLVTQVGEFPATDQGMMRLLRNKGLVKLFSQNKAPLEVFVSPIPSPDTFSGYKWTSSSGPREKILSGTLNTGSITIQDQAPITLVIPWLKKNILGIGT